MPRQDKDGAVPQDRKPRAYGSLFDEPAENTNGGWLWTQVDSKLIAQAIDAVNRKGDAISFATNRSRTAGSVTLLVGGDRPKKWFNSYDEAEHFLGQLADS